MYRPVRRLAAAVVALLTATGLAAATPTVAQPPDVTPAAFVSPDFTAEEVRELLADRQTRNRDVASRAARVAEADDRASRTTPAPVAQPAPPKPAAPKPPKATIPPKPQPPVQVQASGNLAAVVNFALAQAGDRYVWGAAGPNAWDCSALSMVAYARIGVRLPHNAAAQYRFGRPVARAQLRAGDLVFWGNRGGIYHVAISLGGDRIVHAANPRKGVLVAAIYGTPAGYRRIVG